MGYSGGLGEASGDDHGPLLPPEQEAEGGEGGDGAGTPFLRNVRLPSLNTNYQNINLIRAPDV